jgi:hypothetical protein
MSSDTMTAADTTRSGNTGSDTIRTAR